MYLMLLERFLTSVLLGEDEYNIINKNFNVVRLIVTCILVFNLGLTLYLITQMVKIYDKVESTCPGVLTVGVS